MRSAGATGTLQSRVGEIRLAMGVHPRGVTKEEGADRGCAATAATQVAATHTEFRGNAGAQGGGGVQCDGCAVFNSTFGGFSANSAPGGAGGGLA